MQQPGEPAGRAGPACAEEPAPPLRAAPEQAPPELAPPELAPPEQAPPEQAPPGPEDGPQEQSGVSVVLPAAVRDRVVQLASEHLGRLPVAEVPAALRAFARFTPAKRARLAGVPLAVALESDPSFRAAVAGDLVEALPGLAEAVRVGRPLPAAPPEDLAAAAYLLRPPGWTAFVERVAQELSERRRAELQAASVDVVQRLSEQLAAARTAARSELDRVRADADRELAAAREELVALRRKVRELGDRAGRAEAAARVAQEQAQASTAQLREEVQRLQARAAELEAVERAARHLDRDRRTSEELRLRVLLDALLGAATGLRRELALAPLDGRPADMVAAEYAREPGRTDLRGTDARGLDADDPARLEALLGVPLTHLLVDGYNVTKAGYGDLPLEAQRSRLLSGLGALAARTGLETTVVFDGAERTSPVAVAAPRGVRLLFSRVGETADEVLVRLVGAEPVGRPLVVVTSDGAVVDAVRRSGARTAPSLALLRLLGR